MTAERLVKIVLVHATAEERHVETPWAEHLGDARYRLRNSPFYAYGVSFEDIVEATPAPDDPRPHVRRVLQKSGNRTVRIVADEGAPRVPPEILEQLCRLGCDYEGANARCLAINVPPPVRLDDVVDCLKHTRVRWEHVDPTYEQLHPGAH